MAELIESCPFSCGACRGGASADPEAGLCLKRPLGLRPEQLEILSLCRVRSRKARRSPGALFQMPAIRGYRISKRFSLDHRWGFSDLKLAGTRVVV